MSCNKAINAKSINAEKYYQEGKRVLFKNITEKEIDDLTSTLTYLKGKYKTLQDLIGVGEGNLDTLLKEAETKLLAAIKKACDAAEKVTNAGKDTGDLNKKALDIINEANEAVAIVRTAEIDINRLRRDLTNAEEAYKKATECTDAAYNEIGDRLVKVTKDAAKAATKAVTDAGTDAEDKVKWAGCKAETQLTANIDELNKLIRQITALSAGVGAASASAKSDSTLAQSAAQIAKANADKTAAAAEAAVI